MEHKFSETEYKKLVYFALLWLSLGLIMVFIHQLFPLTGLFFILVSSWFIGLLVIYTLGLLRNTY